jgi:tetratricopeptide (TPR) repeat protein
MNNEVKPTEPAPERQLEVEEVLLSEPTNVGALLELGRLAAAHGNYGLALRSFAAAAVLQPKDIWRWLDVAGALVALERIEPAEEVYARILYVNNDQPQALIGLGHCARARGAHQEALSAFQRAAELIPQDMWRWLDVGDELLKLQRLEDAEVAFRRAAIVEPDAMAPALRLGRVARQRGEHKAALAAFQRTAELAPKDMWRWLDVAEELVALGRLPEAERVLSRAVEVAPDQKLPVERLGVCIAARGGVGAQLAYYQDYAKRNPDDLWGRQRVAALLRASGQLDEAEALCRAMLREAPENADTLLELGL